MQYKMLGDSRIKVSKLCLGTMTWGSQNSQKDANEQIEVSLDNGINFFDTAEGYDDDFHSEVILGEALKNKRNNSVIATKISPPNLLPDKIEEACDNSLKRLSTDYIDLYQIHWPNHNVKIEDSLNVLNKLIEKGKIRTIGVCNFGVLDLKDILKFGSITTNQIPYNLLWRPIEQEILPECKNNNIGMICYSPLAQGLLTGRYKNPDDVPDGISRSRLFNNKRPLANHDEEGCEDEVFISIDKIKDISSELGEHPAKISLAWLRHQPNITSLLVGARSVDELNLNLSAFEYELDLDIISNLSNSTEKIKNYLGNNPDMWNSNNRMR